MFGLIRRISNSVVPRPDRPWDDDATSNAPKIGRKRRFSSTERDLDDEAEEQSNKKKSRGDTPQLSAPATEEAGPSQRTESEGVKEVTKGVKEVDLEDEKPKGGADEEGEGEELKDEDVVAPETVPLPKEVSGELDEGSDSSIASTPPAEGAAADDEAEEDRKTVESSEATIAESEQAADSKDDRKEPVPTESVVEPSPASEEPEEEVTSAP